MSQLKERLDLSLHSKIAFTLRAYSLNLVSYAFIIPNIHKVVTCSTRCEIGPLTSGIPFREKDLTVMFINNVDALTIADQRNAGNVQIQTVSRVHLSVVVVIQYLC